jgi:hypothetical protein
MTTTKVRWVSNDQLSFDSKDNRTSHNPSRGTQTPSSLILPGHINWLWKHSDFRKTRKNTRALLRILRPLFRHACHEIFLSSVPFLLTDDAPFLLIDNDVLPCPPLPRIPPCVILPEAPPAYTPCCLARGPIGMHNASSWLRAPKVLHHSSPGSRSQWLSP